MRWTECTRSRRLWSANSEKQRTCRILTTNPAIPSLVVCDQRCVATANFYQLERCRLAVKSARLRRWPLLCDPEIFGKTPRLIHPLCLAVEAGVVCEADEFVMRIFVGAFGPDSFV